MKFIIDVPDVVIDQYQSYAKDNDVECSNAGAFLMQLGEDALEDMMPFVIDQLTDKEYERLKELLADYIELTEHGMKDMDASERSLMQSDLNTLRSIEKKVQYVGSEDNDKRRKRRV